MDLLKTLALTLIILILVSIIPIFCYGIHAQNHFYTYNTEISSIPGPTGYQDRMLELLREDIGYIPESVALSSIDLMESWNNLTKEIIKMDAKIFLYMGILVSAALFTFGIIAIRCKKSKILIASLISSGIISIITYIIIYAYKTNLLYTIFSSIFTY